MSRLRKFLNVKKNRAALAGVLIALLSAYSALAPDQAKAIVDAALKLLGV